MDPITAATTAPSLEPGRPTLPGPDPATAAAGTGPVDPGAAAAGDGTVSNQELAQLTEVAAAFVGQMYMTLWREAQRNSG